MQYSRLIPGILGMENISALEFLGVLIVTRITYYFFKKWLRSRGLDEL